MSRPVIGVMPQYRAKENRIMIVADYFYSIEKAGGVPVLLPLTDRTENAVEIAERFDGFLYPGGPDINPLRFGEETAPECGDIIEERDCLELALLPEILKSEKPVLGVCRGLQVMNVFLGGTLYQDIAQKECGWGRVGHYQKAGDTVLTHTVRIEKNTLLYDIVKKETLAVNSFHHQACKCLGKGLTQNAAAKDGVIEAAALERHKFFLGVQWHPEHLYDTDAAQERIWQAFVESCRTDV